MYLGKDAKARAHSLFQKQHQRGNMYSRTDGHTISPPPPPQLIYPTYISLKTPNIEGSEMRNLEKLKKYYKKRWIGHITPEELSINHLNISTNNAAESYHSKLKSIIKTHRPRIWTFITALNNTIEDVDSHLYDHVWGERFVGQGRKYM